MKKPPSPFVSAASSTTTKTTLWTETGPTRWLIDSGSSFHLVGRKDLPQNVGLERRHLIILHTEWNVFKLLNFKKLVKKKNFSIYDMRNIYSPIKMKHIKIRYFGVGR